MILIDNQKTVIAGDAVKVLTEIAAVLDRLISEITTKTDGPTYKEIQDKFLELMDIVQEVKGDREDFNPQEIVEDGKVQALFKDKFFAVLGGRPQETGKSSSSSKQSESSAEDMLERAMRKLQEQKSTTEKKKKKNKNKKNKKDK